MPKMIFRGCFIRYVDLRYDADAAATHTRIDVTTDFSETVAEEMGWNPMAFMADLPLPVQKILSDYFKAHNQLAWIEAAGLTASKLKGKITATSIELIPNGPEMKKFALDLEANEVRNFSLVRLTDKDGNTKALELRFQIAISQKAASAKLESYLDHVGQGVAQLKIGYQKQEDLDLSAEPEAEAEEETEREGACASCNAGVEFSDEAKGIHTNGQRCKGREPALASAKAAVGGTPGRDKKKKNDAAVN